MAMRCTNCSKGIMYGHNVSHAKNRTRKIFKPNLHSTRVILGGTTTRVKLCTKCLRMYKKAVVQAKQVKETVVETSTDIPATV